ncbi:hypothetical protein DENSPDRAFT_272959 [Dentipellis sp. KUC8613]|nr:hypothetical protein DENSPDRAFT_272959 [Dentipellis sp. KUC8613]
MQHSTYGRLLFRLSHSPMLYEGAYLTPSPRRAIRRGLQKYYSLGFMKDFGATSDHAKRLQTDEFVDHFARIRDVSPAFKKGIRGCHSLERTNLPVCCAMLMTCSIANEPLQISGNASLEVAYKPSAARNLVTLCYV